MRQIREQRPIWGDKGAADALDGDFQSTDHTDNFDDAAAVEGHLLAAILWSHAAEVVRLSGEFSPEDLADWRAQDCIRIAVRLSRQGVQPGPREVLAQALSDGANPSRYKVLERFVLDAYTSGIVGPSLRFYAEKCREFAKRRRIEQAAVELQQIADKAPADDLDRLLVDRLTVLGIGGVR
ncbi:MAG: hypothetical protein LLG14_19605 [Nocardiaceae bacterium]|nr:hypothetical protein [Nocardiaceae bacterium]